jgi:hypothetical protein
MLKIAKERVDAKATEWLRGVKKLRARPDGTLEGGVIAAGYAARKHKKSCYTYPGNSYMSKVWRATFKRSEALDPINNTGAVVLVVDPDLTVRVCELDRPKFGKAEEVDVSGWGLQARGRVDSALSELRTPAGKHIAGTKPDSTPKEFLKALGTDWSVLRARRVGENRMTIELDGERFTIYSRAG